MTPNLINLIGLDSKPTNDCLPDGTFDTPPPVLLSGEPCLIDANDRLKYSPKIERVTYNFYSLRKSIRSFLNYVNQTTCDASPQFLKRGLGCLVAAISYNHRPQDYLHFQMALGCLAILTLEDGIYVYLS